MEIESIFNISKNYSNWGTPYIICEKSVSLTKSINQLQKYKSWILLHFFLKFVACFDLAKVVFITTLTGNAKLRKVPLIPPFCAKSYFNYRKVASSIPVYYSIFDHFWGATNQDVLLTETCYYCYVQKSIKWKGSMNSV